MASSSFFITFIAYRGKINTVTVQTKKLSLVTKKLSITTKKKSEISFGINTYLWEKKVMLMIIIRGRNRRFWRVSRLYPVSSFYLATRHNYNHSAHVYNPTSTCYHQVPMPETTGNNSVADGDDGVPDPSPTHTYSYTFARTWSACATFCPWNGTVSAAHPCDRITRRNAAGYYRRDTVPRIGHPGSCHLPARPSPARRDSIRPPVSSWTPAWGAFDSRVGSATFRLLKLQNAYSLGACTEKEQTRRIKIW